MALLARSQLPPGPNLRPNGQQHPAEQSAGVPLARLRLRFELWKLFEGRNFRAVCYAAESVLAILMRRGLPAVERECLLLAQLADAANVSHALTLVTTWPLETCRAGDPVSRQSHP